MWGRPLTVNPIYAYSKSRCLQVVLVTTSHLLTGNKIIEPQNSEFTKEFVCEHTNQTCKNKEIANATQ